MDEILPRLYLGGYRTLKDTKTLQDHGITLLLNVASEVRAATFGFGCGHVTTTTTHALTWEGIVTQTTHAPSCLG